jgi:class 3 adenylate cyclase/DNA-binding beta-propeller fold protein YncE
MPPAAVRRRLATVLFLDIVGSTPLAGELGDGRWRIVLERFRHVVRRELKRERGREQDTAGDGFFATFGEPVQALRCAVGIATSVQALGLDIRAGVHTGECEEIDGKLGGIAVHIGARVMSLAGAAEVLATGTTRDLVVGSAAVFEELGTRELKGVEGRWIVYRLRSVEVQLPPPLEPQVAAERLAGVTGARRRWRWRSVAAAAVALAAVIVGVVIATGGGASPAKASLLRLNPATGRVTSVVRDGPLGCSCGANLWAVDGTLWEQTGAQGDDISIRSLGTGKVLGTIALPVGSFDFTIGLGAVWIARESVIFSGPNAGRQQNTVERLDELSHRIVAKIPIPVSDNATIATGNGAVWVLDSNGTLLRIDPTANRVTGRFDTGAIETGILVPAAGYEWICECVHHQVLRYDARTRTAKAFHYQEQPWHLVGVDSPARRTVWLLDEQGATITRLNVHTGQAGQPLGLTGRPSQAVLARGNIWVAGGKTVDRISLTTGERTTITLPKGTNATGIAVDTPTGTVWVDNSARNSK